MTNMALAPALTHPRAMRRSPLERPTCLADVLDRVLTKGAVVAGEVVISVAGVDLIYLGVNLVLTSVETARDCQSKRLETCIAVPSK